MILRIDTFHTCLDSSSAHMKGEKHVLFPEHPTLLLGWRQLLGFDRQPLRFEDKISCGVRFC